MNGVVSGDTLVDIAIMFDLSMLKSHDVVPSVPMSIVFVTVSVLLVIVMPGTNVALTSAVVIVICAVAGVNATTARNDRVKQ
jgi:hypothetical protein